MKFAMETISKIRHDESGSRYEIGQDEMGFGLVDIRYYSEDGSEPDRMSFPPELARLVAAALLKHADELEGSTK